MKKILINDNPWQTRIAIMHDTELQNIYFSAHAQKVLERSFFKGKIIKVLPGIQTAFVNIGQERAGFLHISEIDRELAVSEISKKLQLDEDDEKAEKKARQRLDIAKILTEGEDILVQVSKEPVYEKGAKLTTCFTLPGRFIVLMPNIPRLGVSKKIAERDERVRLKEVVRKYLPEGMGGIIRTTSEGRTEAELAKDIQYLITIWRNIEQSFKSAAVAEKIHEDLPLPLQIIRDHLDDDVEAIITDSKASQNEIYNFIKTTASEYRDKVKLYTDDSNIFDNYDVEKQIELALEKKVMLKSGGSLIVETTEAMTVVDVNTGKFTGKGSLEDTIFKINMEAAEEVVRQLKLRNIGGLIVIDFIDMATSSNRQKLFRFFDKNLRERDKFQSVVLKVSEFGLVQMTRKRSGKTLVQQLTDNCSKCAGSGFVKSVQAECYAILRSFEQMLATQEGGDVTLHINNHIFEYITSTEYNAVLDLEKKYKVKITLSSDKSLALHECKIEKK